MKNKKSASRALFCFIALPALVGTSGNSYIGTEQSAFFQACTVLFACSLVFAHLLHAYLAPISLLLACLWQHREEVNFPVATSQCSRALKALPPPEQKQHQALELSPAVNEVLSSSRCGGGLCDRD